MHVYIYSIIMIIMMMMIIINLHTICNVIYNITYIYIYIMMLDVIAYYSIV